MRPSQDHTKHILGIDLGDTIVHRQVDPATGQAMPGQKQAFPEAIEVISTCVQRFKAVHIVSRVTPEQKIRALKWLQDSDFHARTGVPSENVHFCEERHEKAPICERLGVTHFIDDRPEVLSHMSAFIQKIMFRPIGKDVERFRDQLNNAVIANDWDAVRNILLS